MAVKYIYVPTYSSKGWWSATLSDQGWFFDELTAAGQTSYVLACSAGTYTFTGQAAQLSRGYSLTCSAGAYTFAGQAARLSRGYSLACASGTYDFAGQAAQLDYVPGTPAVNYTLVCSAGTYDFAGQAAQLNYAVGGAGQKLDGAATYHVERSKRQFSNARVSAECRAELKATLGRTQVSSACSAVRLAVPTSVQINSELRLGAGQRAFARVQLRAPIAATLRGQFTAYDTDLEDFALLLEAA